MYSSLQVNYLAAVKRLLLAHLSVISLGFVIARVSGCMVFVAILFLLYSKTA